MSERSGDGRNDAQLIELLEKRFKAHPERHPGIGWDTALSVVSSDKALLATLTWMEATGGEPDLIHPFPGEADAAFCDCSPESPAGRRSLCYDVEARIGRRANAPASSAIEMAAANGAGLLAEGQYRSLQRLGIFDQKTSSWVITPDDMRKLGGALFMDRRYGRVFAYHNGAESYYASRGFRAFVRVSITP